MKTSVVELFFYFGTQDKIALLWMWGDRNMIETSKFLSDIFYNDDRLFLVLKWNEYAS